MAMAILAQVQTKLFVPPSAGPVWFVLCTYRSTTPPFGNVPSVHPPRGEAKKKPSETRTSISPSVKPVSMSDRELDKPLVTICNQLDVPEEVRDYMKDAGLIFLSTDSYVALDMWSPFQMGQ